MNELRPYREFRPTPVDTPGLGLADRQDWLVGPVSQTRDSHTLTKSNWQVVTGDIERIDPEGINHELHRFNHWGPGSFEIVLVRPKSAAHTLALQWAEKLAAYPVADEFHWSRLEFDEASEAWQSMHIEDRVAACKRHDVSVFAARRDEIPDDPRGELVRYLADGC